MLDVHVPQLADYLDEWLERRRTRLRPSMNANLADGRAYRLDSDDEVDGATRCGTAQARDFLAFAMATPLA